MNTTNSFNGYGNVDLAQERAFRRKTRRRTVIIVVSTVLLIAIIVGVVAGTVTRSNNTRKDSGQDVPSSIKAVCSQTRYPESCFSSISMADKSNATDPIDLFKLSLQVLFDSLSELSLSPETLMKTTSSKTVNDALNVCKIVLNEAVDYIKDSISSVDGVKSLSVSKIEDLRTWLSTILTNQDTCLDVLQETNLTFSVQMKSRMQNSTEYTSNSLAIVTKVLGILGALDIPTHRKLLGSGFPKWVGAGDRRLLQEGRPAPDVTVAKDGSGDVATITEAMEMVPLKNKTRFVVYIKEGVYLENIVLNKSYWNVMVYGDGMYKSIVSGNLNKADGTRTFQTATLGVNGRGFIAMDMGFENTAGPEKHQAVALRSGSDLSVFYRCSFDAFQDTLYSHSNRQFYRDCDITGTIDFIFGDASVVYQNCKIMPRQPLPNQLVTITAQGRKDPNENSGISIQKCEILALEEDKELTAPTYLGRPWKDYSTTVIMQTKIGGFLEEAGWCEWEKGVDPPDSIFYGEYENWGPGSVVDNRVKWVGYKPILTTEEAEDFTVENFISGPTWLPQTNVVFNATL